jgi:hypothetical protein
MSFFEILAECSVALAGFGAVHAALHGSSSPRGLFRAWTVVLQGTVAFVMCVIPLLLALAALSHEQIWLGASIAAVACTGVPFYLNLSFDFRMARMGHPSQAIVFLRTAQSLSALAVFLLLLNVFGWPLPPGPFLYGAASVCVFMVGFMAMLHSFYLPIQLFFRARSPDKNEL